MPTKTKSAAPRKSRGAVLSPAYRALIGQERTCRTCGETKTIEYRTFAPSKKAKDGVSVDCRQCQGRASGSKLRERREAAGLPTGSHQTIKGFRNQPHVDFEAFCVEIDAYTQELFDLTNRARPPQKEIQAIVRALTRVTRMMDDPAGGGRMTDERLAFKSFMHCLRPALGDWQELGPIHDDILDALLCKDEKVCLLASRGSAKSTITSFYATWKLWRDPADEKILIVSRSEPLARKMLKAIRSYIAMIPLLAELVPADDQIDAADRLEVAPARGRLGMATSVTCKGLSGQITGLRAREIIGDDIEGRADRTPEAVDLLEESIAEFTHVAVPGARVTMLGTPQSNFSLYGRLSRSDAWTVSKACIFESDIIDGKEEFVSRWPARFTPDDLAKRKLSVSRLEFALHYRLELSETADKEQPFRISDLPVLPWPSNSRAAPMDIKGGGEVIRGLPRGSADDDDEWRLVSQISENSGPYTQVVAAVDPASGLRGTKTDAIGLAIIGLTLGGKGVIRVARGVRGASTQEAIRDTARIIAEMGVNKLLVEEVEGGLFGSMLVSELRRLNYPMTYEAKKTGGVKKGRRIIEAISPALASGKLVICQDVLEHEEASDFVIQFTGASVDGRALRHDDVIDALSYAMAECSPVLAADDTELMAASQYTAEELASMPLRRRILSEDEIDAFVEESEEEQTIRLKLQRAIEDQATLLMRGLDTTRLDTYIAQLRSDLEKMEKARRRIVLPQPRHQSRRLTAAEHSGQLQRGLIGDNY